MRSFPLLRLGELPLEYTIIKIACCRSEALQSVQQAPTVEDKAWNKNMTLVVEQGSSFSPKGQGILAFAYSCVAFVVLVLPESVIVKPASVLWQDSFAKANFEI